jgi:hypothetical protein
MSHVHFEVRGATFTICINTEQYYNLFLVLSPAKNRTVRNWIGSIWPHCRAIVLSAVFISS